MILSYKFRVYPNRAQEIALGEMLRDFCRLYNGALEHRIAAYAKGVSVTFYDQSAALPIIRRDAPDTHGRWSATAQLQVLRRLDKAYQAFFGRIKRGAKAGFPRFRSHARHHAADFRIGNGLIIRKSGKIGIVGVLGEIKVRWHRKMPSKPKSAIISRTAGRWYVIFHVEIAEQYGPPRPESVGIDLGLTSLVAISNGEHIARPGWAKRAAKGLRVRQRALARCRRGSITRRKRAAALAKFQAHIVAKRRDFSHKLSRDLVNRFGRIAFEKLNIKGLAAGMLAKHVHDAAWAQIVSFTDYKAAKAGGLMKKVDPRGTSQECPDCAAIAAKPLSERMHCCPCGCVMNRDTASAIVIHVRAFGFVPAGAADGQLTQPVAA